MSCGLFVPQQMFFFLRSWLFDFVLNEYYDFSFC